ncbi:CDP-diacylglycerol--glycerol-3-phosphate 3-phosphatidyltransferase [Azospirillum agricola]|uniref:CDP-diacylglycerol--glycerol-3-phosphate 3-phosphatidyltransferase n=1 Tax=Azospirillum agricola TaxID=1720247 RepID=UPI000A0F324A|nr:CDP-diacylglycerol--glycerol-3-phosphate 3-phosphatidyltransferase [Azospirillum agricola]MBP2227429.1 cardiolipin synthase [Azospirillum agricola]SMH59745.1 CDP-diacylglycerol--glycerol-3-phosphate 3-phosphatidyltransferase [Azospirillum lipoferum]
MLTSLPNLLTLSRIAVIPLVVGLFYIPEAWAAYTACGLYAAACITDWFDGYLARAWAQESVIGKFLDPIADKLLVAATLIMLAGFGRLGGLSILPAVTILLREVLVSGLREYLAGLHVGVPVTWLAKWKTGIQMVALGFLIVGDYAPPEIPSTILGTVGLWIAAALTFYTGWDYMRAGLTHMMAEQPPKRGAAARSAGSAG